MPAMADTSLSLLLRLQTAAAEDDWRRLVDLYTPLLQGWLRGHGLVGPDADDLVQDVLKVVVTDLPGFDHTRRPGAFRRWLRTILVHRVRGFWRGRRGKALASGDSDLLLVLDQLEDPQSGLSKQWDLDHDRHVMAKLLKQIEPQVAEATWKAFSRVVLKGRDEASVAAELGMSVNAVFIAKSRVLARLRQEAEGLIDP